MFQTCTAYHLTLTGTFDAWQMVQREILELKESEILVRMEYTTINPSDYLTILGNYPISSLPMFTEYEGSGTVVETGSSEYVQCLLNKRTALISSEP